jgi:hypothetical protein
MLKKIIERAAALKAGKSQRTAPRAAKARSRSKVAKTRTKATRTSNARAVRPRKTTL